MACEKHTSTQRERVNSQQPFAFSRLLGDADSTTQFDHVIFDTAPTAHIAATVAGQAMSNLTESRINPTVETAKYSSEVMNNAGAGWDEAGRALLAEDLRSVEHDVA